MKIAGSASGSISQRHGSEDPDPFQNVMDPQHWTRYSDPYPNVAVLDRVVVAGSALLCLILLPVRIWARSGSALMRKNPCRDP
jgi:hypothetical protein